MYCCVPVPATIEAVAGVTVMLIMVGAVTVRAALPDVVPDIAFTVDVPAATALASPLALMVAVAGLLLDHETVAVQSELVLLE